ncbi:metallophosphoesterase [Nocardia sp. NPDC088792]|uniref:metallophosphoesterase n=1 Tax=Nocardia sp. NPDC088792 TaxID=3364332 RepID=UPI00380DF9E8
MSSASNIRRRELLIGAAAVAAGATLVGLSPAHAVPVAQGVTKFPFPDGDALRVLITGDAGTGTRSQWAVADAIRDLHRREPVSVALGLGDNIYEYGPDDADDPQFAEKFEKPNDGLDFPWVMTLGNHDNSAVAPGDGGWLDRGNYEVKYHANSPRWWMPSRYYSVRIPEKIPVVEFFVIDINPLAAYIPPFLSPYWSVDGQFMNDQRNWLDQAIAESPAKWKIACTHHPYLSNGPTGDAGNYDGIPVAPMNGVYAKQFFEDHVIGKCHILMSGHDHCLQVLDATPESKGTRQIVCGAAAKVDGTSSGSGRHKTLFETYNQLGYMVADITTDAIDLRVLTVDPAAGGATEAFHRRIA